MESLAREVMIGGFDLSRVRKEVPCMTENGLKVLTDRYLKRDEKGFTEGPAELFRRVANHVAKVETQYNPQANIEQIEHEFYQLMVTGKFMPNSPTLMNAGRNEKGVLNGCFVLPIEDDLRGILDTQRAIGIIQAGGGGTGFCLDRLRPCGDFISSSGGTTSGPLSFWRSYSATTDAIQQGAFRRGANMMMMSVEHPDIIKFLFAKQNLAQFTNYNISIKVTDEFMRAVHEKPSTILVVTNPRTKVRYVIPRHILAKCREAVEISLEDQSRRSVLDNCYGLQDLHKAEEVKADAEEYVTVGDIWSMIIHHAHATAEPGLCFIDRVRECNPTPHVGEIEASNPCGEQYLLPYESCNLGCMNLALYVRQNYLAYHPKGVKPEVGDSSVDWDQLRKDIYVAVRFLDNIIDANNWPLPQIGKICKANRKIGLGVMGLADALFKLGIGYNTGDGLRWAEKFMRFVNESAIQASSALAKEKGCFPNWKGSIWEQRGIEMRNAEVTNCPPTGTVSIIANTSGGIEPLFSIAFVRNVLDGKKLIQHSHIFEEVARARGFWSEGLLEKIAETGSIQDIDGIPADVKKAFVCAMDVSPDWHVKMQAVCQKHVTNAISKTINMPTNATVEDVATAYYTAWKLGCKGVTIYRDGCRKGQPMALVKKEEPQAEEEEGSLVAAEMPDCLPAIRLRAETVFGTFHVNIVVDPMSGREVEIFAQVGRAGEHIGAMLESLCRLGSLWLRAGGSIEDVRHQLIGIKCTLVGKNGNGHESPTSLPNELGNILIDYAMKKAKYGITGLLMGQHLCGDEEEESEEVKQEIKELQTYATTMAQDGDKVKCTKCGGTIAYQEGCKRCLHCNNTTCG